ncbi:Pre-mRNA-splicing factor CWC24 [Diplonema papillatum]|nr:Pre-mRNA-splicing factor CWC24 [Diplonema papillatum]
MFKKRGRCAGTIRRKAEVLEPEADAAADAAGSEDDAEPKDGVKRSRRELAQRQKGGLSFKSETVPLRELEKVGAGFAAELEERKREREDRGHADAGEKVKGSKGPKPLSSTIRMVTVNDTRANICKPYYQTGSCKWGDTCKYAHIREDYMSGADLDNAWERKQNGDDSDSDSSDDQNDGLTCPLCDKRYTDPVALRFCKHVFCAECAMDHDVKTGKCFLCGRQTAGIFNEARDVVRRLKESANAEEKQTRAEEEGGEEDLLFDEDAELTGRTTRKH